MEFDFFEIIIEHHNIYSKNNSILIYKHIDLLPFIVDYRKSVCYIINDIAIRYFACICFIKYTYEIR